MRFVEVTEQANSAARKNKKNNELLSKYAQVAILRSVWQRDASAGQDYNPEDNDARSAVSKRSTGTTETQRDRQDTIRFKRLFGHVETKSIVGSGRFRRQKDTLQVKRNENYW